MDWLGCINRYVVGFNVIFGVGFFCCLCDCYICGVFVWIDVFVGGLGV